MKCKVLSSGQMSCGEIIGKDEETAFSRKKLKEKQLDEERVLQLDGAFDTNDNDEEVMIMEIPNECQDTALLSSKMCADSNIPFLLRLSWDYILYTSIIPLLNIEDILRLRGVSTGFRMMVNGYFAQLKTIDLTSIGSRFTTKAFKVS